MSQIKLDCISPVLGAYVEGFRISPDKLAQSAQQIREWLDRFLVVVVREQALTASAQRDLMKHFGPLFLHHADEGVFHVDGVPEVLEMRKEGDLVFWDNRFTLHYPINDFTGHKRLLLRCTALEA